MSSNIMKSFVLSIVMAMAVIVTAGAIQLSPEYIGEDPILAAQIDKHLEIQDYAHSMAEAARELKAAGMLTEDDANATVTSAQEIWSDSQTEIVALEQAMNKMREVEIPFGPHQPTNLSASAFNTMLAGTPMAGTGEALVRMEQTTGTNGLFTIGVANSESSFGAACYNNNPFGILTSGGLKYFDSWGSAIQYFGELIAGKQGVSAYARASTIEGINDIYCPWDGRYWSSKVRNTMNNCLAKLS